MTNPRVVHGRRSGIRAGAGDGGVAEPVRRGLLLPPLHQLSGGVGAAVLPSCDDPVSRLISGGELSRLRLVTPTARDLALQQFTWIDGHADVWGIFRNAEALSVVVEALVEPFRGACVTAVCGVESRGFLLGGAAAVALGVGFVPVRKGAGLFPGDKVERQAAPDYRGLQHRLRLQRSSLGLDDRVLLVDDWIETGNQAAAVRSMVLECGSDWVGCSVLVDQLAQDRRAEVGPLRALLSFADLPSDHMDR
jgi:adenine phosphoribosyltransferase